MKRVGGRSRAQASAILSVRLPRRQIWRAVAVVAVVALLWLANWVALPGMGTRSIGADANTAGGTGAAAGPAPGAAQPTAASTSKDSPMYYVRTTDKVMGLTFDISWGTDAVKDVLQVLRDHHQRATFFLSGPWSAQHPELVREIARDGHEIASHGEAHVNLSQRSDAEIGANLSAAATTLQRITGQTPRFFRPPNGDFDGRVVRIAHAHGEETVIWAIDSLDWLKRDPQEIAGRVVKGAFPGAVILFHASDSAPKTAEALPRVFTQLTAMGYTLEPLGDLLKLGPVVREDPRGRPYKPNMPKK